MSRALEPTLLSLLPSAASLPQPLVELASSLLAQSRHNASTLKAEEEVARTYACAHIACERLKTTLDLPPIQARPPVQPRIYKRLYTHLDHILPSGGRVRKPSAKARESFGDGSPSLSARKRERLTPSKDMALAQFRSGRGSINGTPTKSASRGSAGAHSSGRNAATPDALPSWVKPTLQRIIANLNEQRVGRIALAGMQTIVVPHGKRVKNNWVNEHLTSLMAAIVFMVSSRFVILETGKDMTPAYYNKLQREIVEAVDQARQEVNMKGIDEDSFWDGWSSITGKDVTEAVKEISANSWQDDDWFMGIQDIVEASRGAAEEDTEMHSGIDDADDDKSQQQRGDTMFQGRWVMTDRKRADYRAWKDDILRKIEDIEKARGQMEVDTAT
ncbi:origin recognition complex subunit 6-domain-containing protein [Xylariales sp. PMI_506]|nr:origin recognition complex subunit 6-domain-containing protein [Xylariales sp. PMI_506]